MKVNCTSVLKPASICGKRRSKRNFAASADSYISSGAATTNFGSQVSMQVLDTGISIKRALLYFDLSALSGLTLYSAWLWLQQTTLVSGTLRVNRLTQAGWTQSGVTWNKYDGTNNWTSAGGDFTATGAVNFSTSAQLEVGVDITALAQDAITSRSNKLELIITDPGATSTTWAFYSTDNSAGGPVLQVLY